MVIHSAQALLLGINPYSIAEIQHSTIYPESKIAEIIELHAEVDNTNLELAKERPNEPPSKPPDLRLHKVGVVDVDVGTESSAEVGASVRGMWTTMTMEGGTRPQVGVIGGKCTTSISRGAEDGVVAKGKVRTKSYTVVRDDVSL
ncbi:hypothetical protein PIB30_074027 [Stylosanthes scabra]|uniref:Uncharacterized protein n=1 Tax=Stylosanthes scabra TaxID=79078 RepID=A0ABU6YNZ1_9FABA|nr:hypothetical protein [Stylosanthes scabra]